MPDNKSYRFTPLDKMMLKGQAMPDDPLALEHLLQEEGFDVSSPQFQRQVDARERQVDERVTEKKRKQRQRPAQYVERRNQLLGMRDWSTIGFSFLFQVLFTVVGVVLLFVSEVIATDLGIFHFFKGQDVIVAILAATLIMLYFALEWRQAALQYERGRVQQFQSTLADVVGRLRYFMSLDHKMERRPKEDRYDVGIINRTRNILIILIVLLGILGRLGDKITTLQGTWYTALVDIFTQSNLSDFLSYVGGGIISAALLIATHFIMSYVYQSYVNAVGEDEVGFFDDSSIGHEKEEARRQLLQFKLNQLWQNKEDNVRASYLALKIEREKQALLPAQVPVMTSNDESEKPLSNTLITPQIEQPVDETKNQIAPTPPAPAPIPLPLPNRPKLPNS